MPSNISDQAPNNTLTPKHLAATGAIALSNGHIFYGRGSGAAGVCAGELCFNTAITGYQEILTDPSYASQIVMFTFPHVGNTGANDQDLEHSAPPAETAARGAVFRAHPTPPANWRSEDHFGAWLRRRGIIAISGVDTRALTRAIRENGMPNVAIAHAPDGGIDADALVAAAKEFAGLEGAELAGDVTTNAPFQPKGGLWAANGAFAPTPANADLDIVVLDFGVKRNILRNLAQAGLKAHVVSADTSADDILKMKPDGVVLSNGPGDPAATAEYAAPTVRALVDAGVPILGICLGHQLLALSLGAKTVKMPQGHHGANHPVKDLATGKVEIVSMNHGFSVDAKTLPEGVEESHISLFDGTNCGLQVAGKPIISVQHHPEASPGPQDSFYIFDRFRDLIEAARA